MFSPTQPKSYVYFLADAAYRPDNYVKFELCWAVFGPDNYVNFDCLGCCCSFWAYKTGRYTIRLPRDASLMWSY